MCTDDRKVWARHLESNGKEATPGQLITWMNTEMKSRVRATAPLRNVGHNPRHPVNHVIPQDNGPTISSSSPKCWICQTSTHWVDQCRKFTSLNPQERLKAAKENHACFSCLKRAGRDHRTTSCSRRRQCPEKLNGIQCTYYHHPLLHAAFQPTGAAISSVTGNKRALLPIVQVDPPWNRKPTKNRKRLAGFRRADQLDKNANRRRPWTKGKEHCNYNH